MTDTRTKIQAILCVGVLASASLALLVVFSSVPSAGQFTYALNNFQSYDQLLGFLKQRGGAGYGRGLYMEKNALDGALPATAPQAQSTSSGQQSPDHSTTNVQVAGVDEPDTVKTDGTYIYTLSNNSIVIVRAFPASNAAMVGRILFDANHSVQSFFLNGDRLIVFCSGGLYYPVLYGGGGILKSESLIAPWYNNMEMSIQVYDLGDRSSPSLLKEIKMDGYFSDARMIGSFIYVVSSTPTYSIYYNDANGNETLRIPTITIDNKTSNISATNIYYVDVPELADSMTHVLSLNIDTNTVNEKSFMLGASQTMYVSQNNIYLATSHYPIRTLASEDSTSTPIETTLVHKIAINASSIAYVAQGEVHGHILNQFSMDEHNGYFRIATTEGYYNSEASQTASSVYILDDHLNAVANLTGIAPGESIYAVRFLGDRAYLVTFVQVDPLFVLDLSNPQHPQILGELKIPGYSTYLHPYDETHIIGIGRDVNRSIDADKVHTPGAVYYTAIQGLKLALFDVTDITNPIQQASVTIGDRGTDSPALYDHHAFLFDHDKNLLVIPVSLYEIPKATLDTANASDVTAIPDDWGQFTFQGAYVYHLTLDGGFQLQGRITHQDNTVQPSSSWYWGSSNTDITRSLFIDDTLYTISQSKVKANSLLDLSEQASIRLA